jgi:hypothetical protein
MVQQIYSEIERLKDEVRRLRGRLNSISVGGSITTNVPGTSPVPPAELGAMIVGNATPAWERLPPPLPTSGEKFALTFDDGDTQPVWRPGGSGKYKQFVYEVSSGTFTFVTDSLGNPVFSLEDLE